MASNAQFRALMLALLLQAFACANVQNRDTEKNDGGEKKDDIEHDELPPLRSAQNLTRIDKSMRFSIFFKSGNHVFAGDPLHTLNPVRHTCDPGAPALPPGGVTPPGPEKYGTFAAR